MYEQAVKTSGQCPKCGSKKLVIDAKVTSGDMSGISVSVVRKPDAMIFKNWQFCPVSACVCGSCGYVEFYAKDPQLLVKDESA